MCDNANSKLETVKVVEINQMSRNVTDSREYCSKSDSNDVTLDAAAVQTRSQVQKELRPLKPLKLTKFDALNLSVDEFKSMQKADPNLSKYWKLAGDVNKCQPDGCIKFVIRNDILYRVYTDDVRNKVYHQLMIPEQLIHRVIAYSHESLLSGHCSTAKTVGILTQEFWFYSVQARVKRWVKSCDLCQRGANRNVGGKAPMMSMPIVKDAFDTVYIDIVGEIKPCSTVVIDTFLQ